MHSKGTDITASEVQVTEPAGPSNARKVDRNPAALAWNIPLFRLKLFSYLNSADQASCLLLCKDSLPQAIQVRWYGATTECPGLKSPDPTRLRLYRSSVRILRDSKMTWSDADKRLACLREMFPRLQRVESPLNSKSPQVELELRTSTTGHVWGCVYRVIASTGEILGNKLDVHTAGPGERWNQTRWVDISTYEEDTEAFVSVMIAWMLGQGVYKDQIDGGGLENMSAAMSQCHIETFLDDIVGAQTALSPSEPSRPWDRITAQSDALEITLQGPFDVSLMARLIVDVYHRAGAVHLQSCQDSELTLTPAEQEDYTTFFAALRRLRSFKIEVRWPSFEADLSHACRANLPPLPSLFPVQNVNFADESRDSSIRHFVLGLHCDIRVNDVPRDSWGAINLDPLANALLVHLGPQCQYTIRIKSANYKNSTCKKTSLTQRNEEEQARNALGKFMTQRLRHDVDDIIARVRNSRQPGWSRKVPARCCGEPDNSADGLADHGC